MLDILDLIEGAQDGNPEAARKLADIVANAIQRPDRSIGAALMPKKRGGITAWQAEQIAERNAAYRDFAVAEYGTQFLTPKQAMRVCEKIERCLSEAHFLEGGDSPQQNALRRIRAAGLGTVGDRQLRNILRPGKKS